MKHLISLVFVFFIGIKLTAQTRQYYKHLIFRETPYSQTKGRIPLTKEQSLKENHFLLKYDNQDRLILIEYKYKDKLIKLSKSGILDGKRALAPKTKIVYNDNKETRTFFNINNKPTANGMGIYKEVYEYNKNGKRISLKYYDENNNPINNSWKVYEYEWSHIDNNSILEKRKNIKGKYVSMRPYYKFDNVLYKFDKKGNLLSMNNVDKNLRLVNDESGIAIDKANYDEKNNLKSFKFFNSKGEPVLVSFLGTAGGGAIYDDKGNCLKYATVNLDGNYMIDKRSNDAYSKYKFDEKGNLIERSNHGLNRELLKRRDIAKVKYVYDSVSPLRLLKTEVYHLNDQEISKDSLLIKLNSKLTKEKLQEDFDQLIETLKKHPSQFQFIDRRSYENLVNVQRNKIKESMTIKEFYQIISPIVTSLGCLHTRIVNTSFFRTPPKYWLPLIVRFENDKMYAINNCVENTEMNIGSEILEINGVSVKEIYNTLKNTISADAFNSNFYKGDLNVNFLYYYHSFYGFNDVYKIKFKPYNSKREIETAFYINEPAPDYKNKIENTPRLNLKINKEKRTAVIRIKNFNYFPRGRQNIDFFKTTIDDYVNKIKQQEVKKVVFDLRGNRGGNPVCTEYLLSYLSSKKLPFYVDNEINKRRNRPIFVEPKENNLSSKKTYFLVDGRCASATAEMLAVIRHNRLATIVGEETGGTYSTSPGRVVKPLVNTKFALQIGTERESNLG